ncbi:MAG TPA: hypothetical protein VJC05_04485 [Candidatus Andersenbacteria bacterium]|nr:hypothetical protein [Candidatus Andersenbacteria bacterium]
MRIIPIATRVRTTQEITHHDLRGPMSPKVAILPAKPTADPATIRIKRQADRDTDGEK